MRFQLIDRVLERDDERIVAVKAVTSAEEYLGDHFPGFPVLPGVMMLETLVQAGRLLAGGGDDPCAVDPMVMIEARNVRYSTMVRPGQQLRVEVQLRKREADRIEFAGVGRVDGEVAVQARFALTPLAPEPVTPERGSVNSNAVPDHTTE